MRAENTERMLDHAEGDIVQATGNTEEGNARHSSVVRRIVTDPTLRVPLLLFATASILSQMWMEIFFIGAAMGDTAGGDISPYFFLVEGMTLLVCALADRQGKMPARPNAIVYASGTLLLGGTFLGACLAIEPPSTSNMPLLFALFGGVGIALFRLAWFSLYERFSVPVAIFCYFVSDILASFATAACNMLPIPLLLAIGFVLPIAGCITLLRAIATAERVSSMIEPNTQKRSFTTIAILMTMMGFAFASRELLVGNSSFDSGSLSAGGSLCIAVVLLGSILVNSRTFNFASVFRVLLPLSVAAFLLLPTNVPVLKSVSDFSSSATYALVENLAIITLASLCRNGFSTAAWAFGITFGLHNVGIFLGRSTWRVFDIMQATDFEITLFFGIVSASVTALTMILLPTKQSFVDWGLEAFTGKSLESIEMDGKAKHERLLHEFASSHGLTAREETVFRCLDEGKTLQQVQDELFISKATVKTHVHNVYGKIGVHSRQELANALSEFERAREKPEADT